MFIRRSNAPLSDDLRIHLLQLPFQTANEHNVATRSRLEQWAFFLRHAHQYDQRQIARILPDPVFQEAKEVLTMISRDPKKRIDYEWRLKQRLDENYLRAEAADEGRMQGREEGLAEGIVQGRSEGLEQGLEKGLEQGLEKGRWIGQISVLEQVLKLPASPLSDLQTWPVEQLAARAEELTRKLASDSR
ncbi:MAG TPA: PD-(D/E)XK nuclease family transposase [Pirellulaceae bacterium]|nr:PD-(D/E)XK nuclease family transposase [Pirellulaceae bacterium]